VLLGVEEDWENLTDYDFMFQLTDEVFINMRSQIVTSSWGGSRIGFKSKE